MTGFRTTRARTGAPGDPAILAARASLVAHARWELVPITSIEPAIAALPAGSRVSVSCSPAKGVDVTLDVCARLLDAERPEAGRLGGGCHQDRRKDQGHRQGGPGCEMRKPQAGSLQSGTAGLSPPVGPRSGPEPGPASAEPKPPLIERASPNT